MKVLLSRWQFGVTITYHFLFVPLTIGLALLVAVMQVLAYRKRDPVWERLTWYFGVLFLINFAMGVVTGIVQEFQFGMNWSSYSVFVGNIFGANDTVKPSGVHLFSAEAEGVEMRHSMVQLGENLGAIMVAAGFACGEEDARIGLGRYRTSVDFLERIA